MPQNQTAPGDESSKLYSAIYYPEDRKVELFRYETLVCTYTDTNDDFASSLISFFQIPENRFNIVYQEIFEE